MALQTFRTDDLTNEPDATTVLVVVNGKGIEVDLAAKSMARLVKALEPFWAVGSEGDYLVTRRERKRSSAATGSDTTREEREAIREWAAANGIDAPARGRMPSDLVEQYRRR